MGADSADSAGGSTASRAPPQPPKAKLLGGNTSVGTADVAPAWAARPGRYPGIEAAAVAAARHERPASGPVAAVAGSGAACDGNDCASSTLMLSNTESSPLAALGAGAGIAALGEPPAPSQVARAAALAFATARVTARSASLGGGGGGGPPGGGGGEAPPGGGGGGCPEAMAASIFF